MTITGEIVPAALRAWAERRMIYIELTDGRIVRFPADCQLICAEDKGYADR